MRSFKFIFLAALIIFSLQACNKGNIFGIRGKGSNVSEIRNTGTFSGVESKIDGDVELIMDSVFKIEVSGQENILKVLETKVEGNNLVIDFKKIVWHHSKIKITVHMPQIRALILSGSGNMAVQNNMNASDCELGISGSGYITVASVNTQFLNAHMSGSGNIKILSGTMASAKFNISGTGNIDAANAPSTALSAKISGSGNISLNATENLSASISGSGDIKYRGNPVINSNISGSGNLVHIQ